MSNKTIGLIQVFSKILRIQLGLCGADIYATKTISPFKDIRISHHLKTCVCVCMHICMYSPSLYFFKESSLGSHDKVKPSLAAHFCDLSIWVARQEDGNECEAGLGHGVRIDICQGRAIVTQILTGVRYWGES